MYIKNLMCKWGTQGIMIKKEELSYPINLLVC